ncbi:MAG: hypothetical protein LBG86_01585, partial [Puniceicoccales bacterium]|nr:hypothetical protein [Puniceicoccales bacterium]
MCVRRKVLAFLGFAAFFAISFSQAAEILRTIDLNERYEVSFSSINPITLKGVGSFFQFENSQLAPGKTVYFKGSQNITFNADDVARGAALIDLCDVSGTKENPFTITFDDGEKCTFQLTSPAGELVVIGPSRVASDGPNCDITIDFNGSQSAMYSTSTAGSLGTRCVSVVGGCMNEQD